MDDVEARCNVYNKTYGTNLTPTEYYELCLDGVIKADKIVVKQFHTTIGIERNVNKKIMRKL